MQSTHIHQGARNISIHQNKKCIHWTGASPKDNHQACQLTIMLRRISSYFRMVMATIDMEEWQFNPWETRWRYTTFCFNVRMVPSHERERTERKFRFNEAFFVHAWRVPEMGVATNHQISTGLSTINHPAIGVFSQLWKSQHSCFLKHVMVTYPLCSVRIPTPSYFRMILQCSGNLCCWNFHTWQSQHGCWTLKRPL